MARDFCDPCCSPFDAFKSIDTYREGVLRTLCNIVSTLGGSLAEEGASTCYPCCNPGEMARSVDSFRASELTILCEINNLLTSEENYIRSLNPYAWYDSSDDVYALYTAGKLLALSDKSGNQNHLSQTSAVSQFTASQADARENWVRKNEEISNATYFDYIRASITGAGPTPPAPYGASYILKEDGTAANTHELRLDTTNTIYLRSGESYTVEVIAKANTRSRISIVQNAGGSAYWDYRADLLDGTSWGSVVGGSTARSITPLGDGWYKVSVTFTANANFTGVPFTLYVNDNSGNVVHNGDNTSSVYIGGIHFRRASKSSTYLINATADPIIAGLNGRKAAYLDGVNDLMGSTLTSQLDQPYTIVSVFELIGDVTAARNLYSLLDASFNVSSTAGTLSGSDKIFQHNAGSAVSSNPITSAHAPSIVTSVVNGSSSALYVNGALNVLGSTNAGARTDNVTLLLGAGLGANYFLGLHGETIIFPGAKTAAELLEVHTYLAAKWGITLV